MELARPLLEDISGSALETVAGISFRRGDTAVMTPARPLVPELDRALTRLALLYWSAARVRNYGRQLAAGSSRVRRANWHLVGRAARFHTRNLFREHRGRDREASGLLFPKWYES